MSIEFLVTSLIIVATPGTGVLYTLAAGLSRGIRASVVAAFGCTLGIIPHMAAAIMGLAALLHASALAFQTLKYLGVAYLLYMAWNTLREQGPLKVETDVDTRSTRQVITSAILINILNPKLSMFFLAFLPQFVPADSPDKTLSFLLLGAMSLLQGFVFLMLLVALATRLSRLQASERSRRVLNALGGGLFLALALRVALSERPQPA